jgi:hypothetical protein
MNSKTLVDYRGQQVRLTAERQAHILEHAEIAGLDSVIEQTVRDPQLVIQSRTDTAAGLHYRFCAGTLVGDKWLCVVVKYVGDDAFVLTAYLTDKPKVGDRLWPRP